MSLDQAREEKTAEGLEEGPGGREDIDAPELIAEPAGATNGNGAHHDAAAEAAPESAAAEPVPADSASAPTTHAELRVLVTKWSSTGDSAYRKLIVKNLGDRVEIENVARSPFALVEFQVQQLELVRTPFELPAPDAPAGTPLAATFESALPLLPSFVPPAGRLDATEEAEHLAWLETVTCPSCESGKAACDRCGGDGQAPCECGGGTVETTVEELVDCPMCSGTGKTPPRVCIPCGGSGSTDCAWCRGTGKGKGGEACGHCEDGRVQCGQCAGTGEVFGRCAKCTGPGKVPMQVTKSSTCPTCNGSAKVPCDTCAHTGRVECAACKGSGSFVRGEHVRRIYTAGDVQRLTSTGSAGTGSAGSAPHSLEDAAIAAATPFTAGDFESVEAIAARLSGTPDLAEAFLGAAREALSAGIALHGRVATAAITEFSTRLDAWTAAFSVTETGESRSIACTNGMQPPVDPKAYGRWQLKENAARTAGYEEAAAAADGIYHAALAQYKQELEAAGATAQDAAAAQVAQAAPAPAPEPEPVRLSWEKHTDEDQAPEADAEPDGRSKERRRGFGLFRRRNRPEEASPAPVEDPAADVWSPKSIAASPAFDAAVAATAAASGSTSAAPAVPAVNLPPAPVRREVPQPELLPPYAELPPELRIA